MKDMNLIQELKILLNINLMDGYFKQMHLNLMVNSNILLYILETWYLSEEYDMNFEPDRMHF